MAQDERSAFEDRLGREDGRRMGGEVVSESAVLAAEGERRLAAVARKLAEAVLAGESGFRWATRPARAEAGLLAREVLAALGPEGGR